MLYKTIVQIYFVIAIGFVLFSTRTLNEELLRDGGVHPLTGLFLVGVILVVGLATISGAAPMLGFLGTVIF